MAFIHDRIAGTQRYNGVGVKASTAPVIPPSDTTAPVVTAFVIPATHSTVNIPITTFTATDAVGVTGYKITESATAPGAGDAGWTASPPSAYAVAGNGAYTLYAWAKDAAGNVSTSLNDACTVTVAADNPDGWSAATTWYGQPSDYQDAADVDVNVLEWGGGSIGLIDYTHQPGGGYGGQDCIRATPQNVVGEVQTGWDSPNKAAANGHTGLLVYSAMCFFSSAWITALSAGSRMGVKWNIFFSGANRQTNICSWGGSDIRRDTTDGLWFNPNDGTVTEFTGRSQETDKGFNLAELANTWFWLCIVYDQQNDAMHLYVKTEAGGLYPTMTKLLHRQKNGYLICSVADAKDHFSPGETITAGNGAQARVDEIGYYSLVITPLNGIDWEDEVTRDTVSGSTSGPYSGTVGKRDLGMDAVLGIANGSIENWCGYWDNDPTDGVTKDSTHYHQFSHVNVADGWVNPPL